jgi:hypothetical protein
MRVEGAAPGLHGFGLLLAGELFHAADFFAGHFLDQGRLLKPRPFKTVQQLRLLAFQDSPNN